MIEKSVQDDLLAYVDGELSPRRAAEIKSLAASDAEVAEAVDELRAHQDLLWATPKVAAPDILWARIERTVAPKPAVLRPAFARWVGAAAAACVLALVGWFALPGGTGPDLSGPDPNPFDKDYIFGNTPANEFVREVYGEANLAVGQGDLDVAHDRLVEIEQYLEENPEAHLSKHWRDKLDRTYVQVMLGLIRNDLDSGNFEHAAELNDQLDARLKNSPLTLTEQESKQLELLHQDLH